MVVRGLVTVTSVIRRTGLLMTAVASVAALTACGTGSSQPNAAVIIDDRTISVDDVQSMLDRIVKEQPAAQTLAQQHKLDLVAREIVTQLVTHELLTAVAEADDLTPDPDQVQEFKEQNPFAEELPTDGSVPPEQLVSQLVYRARGADAYVNDQLLLAELASTYLGRAQATYNILAVSDGGEARKLAEEIAADPDRSGDLMDAAQGELGAPALEQPTGGSPNGVLLAGVDNAVYIFPPAEGSGEAYNVVHVLSTDVSSTPADDFDPTQIEATQLPSLGRYLLRAQAVEDHIEISPRFGVWNYATQTVVPTTEAEVGEQVVLPAADNR